MAPKVIDRRCRGGLSARLVRPAAFAPSALRRAVPELAQKWSERRRERAALHLLVIAVAAVAACSPEPKTPASQPASSTSQRLAIGQLPTIGVDALLAHTRTLSSDEYEGRAPGTKGEQLTVTYLADEFQKVG